MLQPQKFNLNDETVSGISRNANTIIKESTTNKSSQSPLKLSKNNRSAY